MLEAPDEIPPELFPWGSGKLGRRYKPVGWPVKVLFGLIGPNADDAAFRLPEVPAVAMPIIETLPAQMLSVGIARRKGIEPGMFIVNTKVTATE